MNVSPSPIKVCKGMKLGEVIPIHRIQMVKCDSLEDHNNESCIPEVNLDSSTLSSMEKTDLLSLLVEYSDVFVKAESHG